MAAGSRVVLLGNSNQEEAVSGMRTDLQLPLTVTLLSGRGRVVLPFWKKSLFSLCRQVALVGVRGEVDGEE